MRVVLAPANAPSGLRKEAWKRSRTEGTRSAKSSSKGPGGPGVVVPTQGRRATRAVGPVYTHRNLPPRSCNHPPPATASGPPGEPRRHGSLEVDGEEFSGVERLERRA